MIPTVMSLLTTAVLIWGFIKIKDDIHSLKLDRDKQMDLLSRFMKGLVTKEQMEEYIHKINEEREQVVKLQNNFTKQKWSNFRQAFGEKEGKEE